MGGGRRESEVRYIQPPAYQAPPAEAEADKQFRADQKTQMDALNKSYQTSLDAMKQQYEQQTTNSASVMQTLQDSMTRQQSDAAGTRSQLDAARAASQTQLDMLEAVRNKSSTQTAEMNRRGLEQSGSVMGRMSRRQAARQVQY